MKAVTGRMRNNPLMIMLSDTEKAKIAKAANNNGMTMSAYARAVLINYATTSKVVNDDG